MNISVKKICSFFDKTRQAFYKSQERALKGFLQEQSILSAVKQIRKEQPRVGSRKLWLHLKRLDFNVGRDRLFNILRKNGLLIKPRKRYTTTTNSHHWFRKYTNILKKNDVMISMTEDNHCYENAIAERVNGILKDEFYLGDTLPSFTIAKELVTDAILIYNTKRLHMNNNYKTPKEVHHY